MSQFHLAESSASKGWLAVLLDFCVPLRMRKGQMLYVYVLMISVAAAAAIASWTSPSPALRVLCALASVLVFLLLVAFSFGLSVRMAVHWGSALCITHVTVAAWLSGGIYSSALAWLSLLMITNFYINGPRAGWAWLWGVLGSLSFQSLLSAYPDWRPDFVFDVGQSATSLTDYLISMLIIILVPWIYKNRYDRALQLSQMRHAQLQVKLEELESALQMRENFVAAISHELRTPMNAILGLNALLLSSVQGNHRALDVLGQTRQSADHLMTVINDVLDYSQLHSGELKANVERFLLRPHIDAAFELLRGRIERPNVQYQCDVAPDVPQWVETDKQRLTQVLVSLLGNALKFTHQGLVRLHVCLATEGLRFEVYDSGIGIALEDQSRIFEPFTHAHAGIQRAYGGTGLGLTISHRLVVLMGGSMGLRSSPGAGSMFWFVLPVAASLEMPPFELDAHTPCRSLRFLVVDDHPVNRMLVKLMLKRAWPACEVKEAEDGVLALERLSENRFDVVFMDMVMPRMDGIDTTSAIRSRESVLHIPGVPVVGLTANVNSQDLQRFSAAGLTALLLKPFEPDLLCQQVAQLVGSAAAADADALMLT